jgi:hypothetical protein
MGVFERIRGQRILRTSGIGGRARAVSAWLAILGLYVQLFATGLCAAPLDPALGNAAQGAFPICHTPRDSNQSAPTQAPAPFHQTCPFCALHCHAAMVMAPSIGVIQTFVAVSTHPAQAIFIAPSPARFSAGAPPRGPPASA